MTAGLAARAARSQPARRSRGKRCPARPPHGARSGPGRCRSHPATATPPAADSSGPSWPAAMSCRNRRARRRAPGRVAGPHRGVPPAGGGAGSPDAARAGAAWWTAEEALRPASSRAPSSGAVAAGRSAIADPHAQNLQGLFMPPAAGRTIVVTAGCRQPLPRPRKTWHTRGQYRPEGPMPHRLVPLRRGRFHLRCPLSGDARTPGCLRNVPG